MLRFAFVFYVYFWTPVDLFVWGVFVCQRRARRRPRPCWFESAALEKIIHSEDRVQLPRVSFDPDGPIETVAILRRGLQTSGEPFMAARKACS